MRKLYLVTLTEAGLSRSDAEIHDALGVAMSTIERVRQRFVEDGLEAALERRRLTRQYERLIDGAAEAHLIALACGEPPEGHECWTLRLPANQMVALEHCDTVSHETVRRVLRNELKPWRKKMWVIAPPSIGAVITTEKSPAVAVRLLLRLYYHRTRWTTKPAYPIPKEMILSFELLAFL